MSLPHVYRATQIHQDWQRAMDTALEAGQPPLLEWGMPHHQLNHLPILLAYRTWNASRGDVTQPVMLTGGINSAWLAPLFLNNADSVLSHPTLDSPSPPPLMFVYGGADQATYLASMTTQAAEHLLARSLYAVDLPVAMQPLLAPVTQSQAHMAWHALPLTLLFAAQRTLTVASPTKQSRTNQQMNATPLERQGADRQKLDRHATVDDPWLTWTALVMIVALILLALFL